MIWKEPVFYAGCGSRLLLVAARGQMANLHPLFSFDLVSALLLG